MLIAGLSEAAIRTHAAPESFNRGMSYYHAGAVGDLVLRGDALQAEVEGSQHPSYRVRVAFDQGGVTAATCSCPYDWGGWCKHIVATLLKAVYEPDTIESRPTLDVLLSDLDRSQLQALLVALADRDPAIADEIERRTLLLRLSSAAPQERPSGASPRRSPIDQEAIRKQVRYAMRPARRSRYDDYDDYDDEEDPGVEIVEAVQPLLGQAEGFVAAGDARSALAILEALTTEYLSGYGALSGEWEEMYGSYEGEASSFFDELARVWAEAVLSADLDQDEREQWGEKIAGWRDEAENYGAGGAFELALTAAEQGWDYPPLRRALSGEITAQGAWEGESPDFADELALIRLRILERQGRAQEYLYLAEAEGQIDRYVAMLAKLGRTREAVEEGLKYLTTPAEAAEVAKLLREQGDLEGAWRIAERGLALSSPGFSAEYSYHGDQQKAALANWATDLAAGMGNPERALRAAEAAFRAGPSLSAYLKVQELAGERWEKIKPQLLAHLRRWPTAEAKVDVFLHERLYDDAIAAVKGTFGFGQIERVMDAVVAVRPDWVIQEATAQAERIMGAGKAERYDAAANWLRRARAAFLAAGREDDWSGYMQDVRAKHGRKYKLMGLLAQL